MALDGLKVTKSCTIEDTIIQKKFTIIQNFNTYKLEYIYSTAFTILNIYNQRRMLDSHQPIRDKKGIM